MVVRNRVLSFLVANRKKEIKGLERNMKKNVRI